MQENGEREFRAAVSGGEIVGWTRGSGPPALLLHGGPGLSDYLAPLAAELAPSLTVARYQQRGLPPSLTGGDRGVDAHVADAVAVMDRLGWKRAWVVGHSWGGHLAMHVAVAHPERVMGLAVLDSLGAVPDGGASALGENLTGSLAPGDLARVQELNAREEAGSATEADGLESLRIVWPYYFAAPAAAPPMPEMRMDQEGFLATWTSITAHFERGTLVEGLPSLTAPVLVLHGAGSPIPVAEAERTAQQMPTARLKILPEVGHFAWLERPGSMRREIDALLSRS